MRRPLEPWNDLGRNEEPNLFVRGHIILRQDNNANVSGYLLLRR